MNLSYLAPLLSIPAAMLAPAADVQVPESAETAAELLPVLRGVRELSQQEARELLVRLPVPKKCSRELRNMLSMWKTVRVLLPLMAQQRSLTPEDREELFRISPRIWVFCLTLELNMAQKKGDKALEESLLAEGEQGLQRVGSGSELGALRALGFSFLLQKHSARDAESNRWVAERLREERNAADAQVSLAVMYLYPEYGQVVDVELAMQHALRGVVALHYLMPAEVSLRNNLCLSLARAASLCGEAALPLQVAALRCLGPKEEKSAGLGAYRLGKLYRSMPENLSTVSEELSKLAFVAGGRMGHPACLQELAELSQQPEQQEELMRMAREQGGDPAKDYLHSEHGRAIWLSIEATSATLPSPEEREVAHWLSCLIARTDMVSWMLPESASEEELLTMSRAFGRYVDVLADMNEDAEFSDVLEEADATEDERYEKMKDFFRKIQNGLDGFAAEDEAAFRARYAEISEYVLETLKVGKDQAGEECLALLQQLADAKNADALYILAKRQVEFLGEFTGESWGQMQEACMLGCGEAAWFLFRAFREGIYGVEQDPLSAVTCYRLALAHLCTDAWESVLARAEGDTQRLYALVHLWCAADYGKYNQQLDEALVAYGKAHPELLGIVTPLRLLCLARALSDGDLSAEEKRETRSRCLQIATSLQPAVLTPEDVEYWRQLAEYEHKTGQNKERAAAAQRALPFLQDGRADMLLVEDGRVIHEQAGSNPAQLPAEKLKGTHLVCRACDRALADFAIQAGVRSVTALRMSATERDYLRAHNIAAGGWTIVKNGE